MKYIVDVSDEAVGFMDGEMSFFVEPKIKDERRRHYVLRIDEEDVSIYTEPDRKAIEDEVWEFAREMISTSGHEMSEMWGCVTNFGEVMHNTTYQEAKSKFEAWMKQKDEIHVGDEIVGIYSDGEKTPPLVVLKVEGNYYYGIYSKTGEFVQGGLNYEKTGRHFDEVEELLKKMRGEE